MPAQPMLMVPIHLDALLVPTEQAIVAPTADFAALPYFDGKRDRNGSTAYLSEAILSRPFQNCNLYLPPGVHLHWSLPDALTRASRAPLQDGDEDPDDLEVESARAPEFPCVPNRWLVVRSGAGQPERAWVVESDYLHPAASGPQADSATYLIRPAQGEHPAPFRYLGRTLPFDEWQMHGEQGTYLDSLTAVGYGEPTFAALYANCRNVFGLHDAEVQTALPGLRYDLVGWYSDDHQDYVRLLAADLQAPEHGAVPSDRLLTALAERARWAPQIIVRQEQLHNIADADRLWDELVARGWIVPLAVDPAQATLMAVSWRAGRPLADRAAQEQVEAVLGRLEYEAIGELTEAGQMLCYARLTFAEPQTRAAPTQPLQVTVGNTGPQALSTYLAHRLAQAQPELDPHKAGRPTLEDRIEAIMLAPRLRDRRLDLDATFREARHETGFTALQSGHVWTLLQQPRQPGQADAPQASQQQQLAQLLSPAELALLDEISHRLNALNDAQQEYDRATHTIESLRQQLFADWYRYMLCLYPVEGAAEHYPAIDELRHYIEQAMLPLLRSRIAQAGRLVHQHEQDAWRAPYPVAVNGGPDTLAGVVAREAGLLRARLDQLNQSETLVKANLVYKLGRTHGSRYWQPNNPVVLLAGEELRPTMRHGHDGRVRTDGMLGCRIVSDEALAGKPLTPQTLPDLIDSLTKDDADEETGFFTWTGQPWHPLLLEWEVELLPLAGRGRLDPQGGAYASDFITANYAPAENEPDLAVRSGKERLTSASNYYSGSSILTPYARPFHGQRLAAYILNIYCKAVGLPIPPDEEAEAYLVAHRDEVLDWHNKQGHGGQDEEDSLTIALAAFDQLHAVQVLSQSLGGFNEALLTRKQTLQLNVDDPLAFADFRPFVEEVRDLVGRGNSSAPQPLNDFNPIRSGAIRLLRLRLVDSFGQVRDIDVGAPLATQQMRAAGGFVALPPRLVQPARLNFRWLSADLGDRQMSGQASETPICGWVVPNNLDDSLMIYDGAGKALGVIDVVEGKVSWLQAPGAPVLPADRIADDHLRTMVADLLARDGAFISAFRAAIESATEQIDPANYAQHPELALLMGRPLALVRAELSLELQGLPAVHQGWSQLQRDLRSATRDSDGFTRVEIPIRIGDYSQLDDGLVGYWVEQGDGYSKTFYAPQSEKIDSPDIQTHADGELVIHQSLDAPPQTLSALVDPRGTLHVTCGVLPVKAISIPPEQYSDALRRIEVTFEAGPILSGPRMLGLPLPAEPGYAWSWLERAGEGWRETWTFPTIDRAAFEGGLGLMLWERLTGGPGAWLHLAEDRRAAELAPEGQRVALAPELAPFAPELDAVLAQLAAAGGPVARETFVAATGAAVGGQLWERLHGAEVGWLEAMPGDTPLARITIKSAGAAKGLPAPYAGAEALIEGVIDRNLTDILPPSSVARFGARQDVREGWLKLSVAKATT